MKSLPKFDPTRPWDSADLRSRDASDLDLRGLSAELALGQFDGYTVWPPNERLPNDFDPGRVLELGKNPGLGIRGLHAQGITGRGIRIGIVDQTLLTRHVEYAAQLRWYEELAGPQSTPSEMHGPAVASIAVGKTVGVAPEAELFYIGYQPGPGFVPLRAHAQERGPGM